MRALKYPKQAVLDPWYVQVDMEKTYMTTSTVLFWSADMRDPVPPVNQVGIYI